MSDPDYLTDPAFLEPHSGPHVTKCGYELLPRDPSPDQIERMCAAIQESWTEAEWHRAMGRSRGVRELRVLRYSEATHIPHEIQAPRSPRGRHWIF